MSAREGLEHALALLRGHMAPLMNGDNGKRHREVLRCAKALANAVKELHAPARLNVESS
jgi:hypothetical protein